MKVFSEIIYVKCVFFSLQTYFRVKIMLIFQEFLRPLPSKYTYKNLNEDKQ